MSIREKIKGQIEEWQTSRKEEATFKNILEKKAKAKRRKAYEEGYIKGQTISARRRGFEEGKGRRGEGGSILDRLGASAWEQFGEQPKGKVSGPSLPHLESGGVGFGMAALEAEGIMKKKKVHKKHKKKKSRRKGRSKRSPRVIIIR